jgi:hypothetical protein
VLKGEYNEDRGCGCGYFYIRDRDRDGLKNPGKTVLNLKVDRAKRSLRLHGDLLTVIGLRGVGFEVVNCCVILI